MEIETRGENTGIRAITVTILGITTFLILIFFMTAWIWVAIPIRIHTTAGNNTITGFGEITEPTNTTALNQISAQSVPSMINGITTSTSIIIGFSATLCGIIVSIFGKDDPRVSKFLLVVLSLYSIPLVMLFLSFQVMAVGEQFFGVALKYSWTSLLYSLFILVCIFAFTTFLMHEQEKKLKSDHKEPSSTNEEQNRETTKKGQGEEHNKNVNVFVNVS